VGTIFADPKPPSLREITGPKNGVEEQLCPRRLEKCEVKMMLSRGFKVMLFGILLGAVLGVTIQPAAAQELRGFSRPRTVTKATSVRTIPAGEKVTLTGNVIKVEGDTFSICDFKGAETVVLITPSTKISTHRRGIFRGAETLDKDALMVGLRVQARGRGDDSGHLAAQWVRFHDADLRAQTEIETRAIPIENEQMRQWEQMEETHGVASTALKNARTAQDTADLGRAEAAKAQGTADTAQSTAVAAHNKIGAIDDFELAEALTINFKVASAKLTPEAKAMLDGFAAKAVSARGFLIEVSGFASSEGRVYQNHDLSARRAEAVMDYLIGVGNVPVRRIVVPYSGGILNPVADNKTREGREMNRRVEVKMLVSKVLAEKEQFTVSQK
jgi:outer membrane protein OmpA-like peptidoglycan-associated protein